MNKCTFALAAMLALTGIRSAVSQGPLNPPGAPAPTMKTLDELATKVDQNAFKLDQAAEKTEKRIPISTLPFVISVPGSYYLTRNLSYGGESDAIEIGASNVTLDLNGFALIGTSPSATNTAVRAEGTAANPVRNVMVKNGSVDGFYYALYGFNAQNSAWQDVRCSAQRGFAVILQDSSGNLLSRVVVTKAAFSGFSLSGTANNNHFQDCSATACEFHGFEISANVMSLGNVLERCVAGFNKQVGFRFAGGGAAGNHVRDCTATANIGDGILISGVTSIGNRIDSNQVFRNGGAGIRTVGTSKNIIVRNTLSANAPSVFAAGDTVGSAITASGTINSDQPWANFIIP